jgi:CheY-like chemotaxis protein
MSSPPSKAILLVDDDLELREALRELFLSQGFAVTTAEDGLAALALLRTAKFDLLISDLHMPRMNGADLLKRAAEEGLLESTEVMVATGQPDRAKGLPARVFAKPFDLDALLDAVGSRFK